MPTTRAFGSRKKRSSRRDYHRRKVVPCPYCHKAFSCDFNRDQHVRGQHTGERPFECHCGKTYGRRWLMLRHQRLIHGETDGEAEERLGSDPEHSSQAFDEMAMDLEPSPSSSAVVDDAVSDVDTTGEDLTVESSAEAQAEAQDQAPAMDLPVASSTSTSIRQVASMEQIKVAIRGMPEVDDIEKDRIIDEIRQARASEPAPVTTPSTHAATGNHERPPYYVCGECDEGFDHFEQIIIHRHMHHRDPVSIECCCRYCKYELGIPDDMFS